jgi:hypothetical protein
MTKGALLIARNNGNLDYVKQAVFLAKRIIKYLDIPVSIVTDSVDYLKNNFDSEIFDNIISVEYTEDNNRRNYFDGSLTKKVLSFKNFNRYEAYNLTPYDQTLLLDTDYIINNDKLKNCFDSTADLMLFKESKDLSETRDLDEFQKLSDSGIDFYWATVVYFKKTLKNQIFFDLVSHIKENWEFYRKRYYISESLFRNDYAFSIAIHILNNFKNNPPIEIVSPLPIKHVYTLDKDLLLDIKDDSMKFLVQKKDYLGEYTAVTTNEINVHVMNKFSLERIIDKG